MKLFEDFEAVKFSQENLIFVTHNEYLYYIYNPKYNYIMLTDRKKIIPM